MSDSIAVGVIGVGALGQHHARLYHELPHADLVGVYDVREERAQEIAQQYGCAAYSDIDQLAERCTAVSIAVPTDMHYEVGRSLLGRGLHILMEKPLCDHLGRARELVEFANARGLVLHVGHVEHFNPVMDYLEAQIRKPLFIEAHRLASFPEPLPGGRRRGTEVGVVLDLMIHDLEIILALVGREVISVSAVGVPVLSSWEDIANARIEFEGGCVANVTASRVSAERMRKIRVFQPDAYLSLDYGLQDGRLHRVSGEAIEVEAVPLARQEPLKRELAAFIDAIRGGGGAQGGKAPVTGEHGLRALELAMRITDDIRGRLELYRWGHQK
ncbi:MAG: Gfo/Idh/MocA family oxidoreductase [Verrucomicrobiota bacterium]|nr:Gfo/Idh/MocA family oxidoreductase [Verrucomicrobiota bacterium]MDD8047304.1 Gfo/Idh/MocA family oxidoreductase [Verrucomicrobiota bacterium]MDD8051861.1 Gfo/Idh/MocA family oxidoreductase [Verrucomicrobiota bacterium]MDI9384524.1 Gfo/Idh/MocA family oxidoreductase [Verrucomicrobiota bacterium]